MIASEAHHHTFWDDGGEPLSVRLIPYADTLLSIDQIVFLLSPSYKTLRENTRAFETAFCREFPTVWDRMPTEPDRRTDPWASPIASPSTYSAKLPKSVRARHASNRSPISSRIVVEIVRAVIEA